MAIYSFRKCVTNPGNGLITTPIVAKVSSVYGNNTRFDYASFWHAYLNCLNSYYPLSASDDYMHTPTGYASDCALIPQKVMWAACLSALCGVNSGNTECELI
jgi:hypothetical protein